MQGGEGQERRKYSRVPFEAETLLEQGGKKFSTTLLDISLNGLLIKTPVDYHIRTDLGCVAHIKLANNTKINMQVTLIHSSSEVLGFQCTSIDMDSVIHLRRVIELNLENQGASERALAELVQGIWS